MMFTNARESIQSVTEKCMRALKTDLRSLAASNMLLMLTRVVGVVTGIVFTIACANLLSPADFGTYKYILASAGLIAAFSLSGLYTAATREIARGHDAAMWPLFKIGVLTSLPAAIGGLGIALYYFIHDNSFLGLCFFIIAITIPLSNNLGISKSIILGKEDYFTYFIYQSIGAAVPILLLVGIVAYTQNISYVIVGYFVINLVSGMIILAACFRKYRLPTKEPADIKQALTFGSHMSVTGFFSQMSNQIDQLLLWHFAGPAAVAHYALALAPMRELRIGLENIPMMLFPRFAKYEKNVAKSRVPLRTFQFFIICTIAAGAYIIFAPFLFALVFPQYLWAVDISRVMALGLLVLPRSIPETYLTVHGVVRVRYMVTTISLIVKILLFVVLIPLYSIVGAVIAILASEVVSALIILYYYRTH
jgi:O-antigen/teichoic acid export membrane protein